MKKIFIACSIIFTGCTMRVYDKTFITDGKITGKEHYQESTLLNLRKQKGLVVGNETKSGTRTGLRVSDVTDAIDNDALKLIVDPLTGMLKVVKP